jgi:hypothetical protein
MMAVTGQKKIAMMTLSLTDDFLWVIGDASKGIPPYTIK